MNIINRALRKNSWLAYNTGYRLQWTVPCRDRALRRTGRAAGFSETPPPPIFLIGVPNAAENLWSPPAWVGVGCKLNAKSRCLQSVFIFKHLHLFVVTADGRPLIRPFIRHRLIWSPCVHWSLMLPADNTSALPAVINWLFCVTGAPHLAVGPSLLRALWHGMRCLTMSEIRRWDAAHFNVSSRHFCSRSTSFPSVLEVFHDYALYKFTIDIDIDI